MKKQLLALTLLSTLLLTALLGCDKTDPAGTEQPTAGSTSKTTSIVTTSAAKTTTKNSVPSKAPATTTEQTDNSPNPLIIVPQTEPFVGLNITESGTIYYDRYLKDNGIPKSAVFVPASGGTKQYFVYDGKSTWMKLPERSYRGDLLWGTFIEDGNYVNYNGGFPQGEGKTTIWSIVYSCGLNTYNLPACFLTVDKVEISTVFKVEIITESSDMDSPEKREALFAEQEAYF